MCEIFKKQFFKQQKNRKIIKNIVYYFHRLCNLSVNKRDCLFWPVIGSDLLSCYLLFPDKERGLTVQYKTWCVATRAQASYLADFKYFIFLLKHSQE
jgi:hypothetical protein